MTTYRIALKGNDDVQRVNADNYNPYDELVTFVRYESRPWGYGGTRDIEISIRSYAKGSIESIELVEDEAE